MKWQILHSGGCIAWQDTQHNEPTPDAPAGEALAELRRNLHLSRLNLPYRGFTEGGQGPSARGLMHGRDGPHPTSTLHADMTFQDLINPDRDYGQEAS